MPIALVLFPHRANGFACSPVSVFVNVFFQESEMEGFVKCLHAGLVKVKWVSFGSQRVALMSDILLCCMLLYVGYTKKDEISSKSECITYTKSRAVPVWVGISLSLITYI